MKTTVPFHVVPVQYFRTVSDDHIGQLGTESAGRCLVIRFPEVCFGQLSSLYRERNGEAFRVVELR